MQTLKILGAALAALSLCASASAQDKPRLLNEILGGAAPVKSIAPVFSQLLLVGQPAGFRSAFENTKGSFYVHEWVPSGETVDNWTKMMTVTGLKDLAANSAATPKSVLNGMAAGFQRACPSSYSAQSVAEGKLSGFDAFMAVVSCGASPSTGGKSSETALIMVVKGQSDYYTFQWAERSAPSSGPIAIDVPAWAGKWKLMSPVKLCPIIPGEAPPYPSCVGP